jgi:hypothetical protein
MSSDERELRITERVITDAMHSVEHDLPEPVELWARIEERLDGSRARGKWFPLTLATAAAAAAVAVLVSVAIWRGGDRQVLSTGSDHRSITTIEAACESLLSMRQDVTPLPDGRALMFTVHRMQAAFDAAAVAVDSVAPSGLSPAVRDALVAWRSIFESDALHRIHQAATDIDDGEGTAARQSAGGAMAMMVVALDELRAAGIASCDPHR